MAIDMDHTAATGMIAVEQEQWRDADCVWRQVWVLQPAPEPELVE